MLYRIDIRYACFGIIVKDNIIIEVAPIAKWMIGKNIQEVILWVNRKGGTCLSIPN